VSQSSWVPPAAVKMSRRSSRTPFAAQVGMLVVGAEELRRSFDGRPLPTGACDDGDAGVGAEVVQLAGAADGHESDDRRTGQRVFQDSGVDH
jgi:hypothetical protein